MVANLPEETLNQKLGAVGQEHLVRFWDELNEEQKTQLWEQLREIDFDHVNRIFKEFAQPKPIDSSAICPIASDHYGCSATVDEQTRQNYWKTGLSAIAAGHVGVIVLAGGQATRLGASAPKGTIPLGLKRQHDSLLQIQASQIIKLQSLAKVVYPDSQPIIHWIDFWMNFGYVMTSKATDAATKAHIHDQVLPELSAHQIHFFSQAEMPCFTADGKLMLAEKGRLATSPDGNGGLYSALNPLLPDIESNGIRYLHVYCVDNVLCRVADPTFLGFCIQSGADCAAKVVTKTDPKEAVGVVCQVNGIPQVLEYSEISESLANQRDSDQPDKLALRAGNIANHFFTTDFLKIVCPKPLPFHPAHKKIPCVNDEGETIKPKAPNGVKMEQFVFDVFRHSKSFYVWEVNRCDEFSPLKNADSAGVDCLSTCRRDLWTLHTRWIENAGGKIEGGAAANGGDTKSADANAVEIGPKLTYAGEGLEPIVQGKTFTPPVFLQ